MWKRFKQRVTWHIFGTTVDSILGDTRRIVADLEAHAKMSLDQRVFHKAQAQVHAAEANRHFDEASRAEIAAEKFRSLLS